MSVIMAGPRVLSAVGKTKKMPPTKLLKSLIYFYTITELTIKMVYGWIKAILQIFTENCLIEKQKLHY